MKHIIFHPQLSIENSTNSNWLKLKNPKIVSTNSLCKDKNSILISSSVDPIKQLDPILQESRENSLLSRIEKKNKYNNKSIDILDIQKNKSKLKKKIRTKIHIGEEEDNVDANIIESIKANNNVSLPFMRPIKPLKRKIHHQNQNINLSIKTKTRKHIENKLNDQVIDSTQQILEKKVFLNNSLNIQELSSKLLIPEADIIKWLFLQGILVTTNQTIDNSIATLIVEHYGFTVGIENVNNIKLPITKYEYDNDKRKSLDYRAPIVTILGHVDHGKTTLLDTICKTNNVSFEAGGITQAISTHEIEILDKLIKKKIVFLDTPGHEAFSDMRIRCTNVADICILLIAADDSLQPQSIEAIEYIQRNNIPFLVVINKIDKPDTNILRVQEDLAKYNIISKAWGGNISFIEVSALTNMNIDLLIKNIIDLAQDQELKADMKTTAKGSVLNSYLDKTKGPVATILIKNGTLEVGNFIVIDNIISKIRAIVDNKDLKLNVVGPSSVVHIWGLSNLPISGSTFESAYDEKQAKRITKNVDPFVFSQNKNLNNRMRLDAAKSSKENIFNEKINLILKTDTYGSINAIINVFNKIPQKKVQLNIILIAVGKITESDLQLALVSKSIVVGFNISPDNNTKMMAGKLAITISNFDVIYDLISYIQEQMLALVKIEYKEHIIGSATVENVFNVSKGIVAGCIVKFGKLKQSAYIRIKRNKVVIYDGRLSSLKRIKEDVLEVKVGSECGILISNFNNWDRQDEIESYELIAKDKVLE